MQQPSLFESDEPAEPELVALGGSEAQQRWDEGRKGCHRVTDGTHVYFVKLGGRAASSPSCPFCGKRLVTHECDYPLPDGKTCDAKMCGVCARQTGRNRHFCPDCVKKLEMK